MSAASVIRLATVAALAVAAGASRPGVAAPAQEGCRELKLGRGYSARVDRALRSGRDVWGEQLLAAPGGPSYERVRRLLPPLLLARAAERTRLTGSGVHYLAFSRPAGARGAGVVALHVADGSGMVWRRVGGPALAVGVGRGGRERYGSCLARLAPPVLRDGYLPILQTRYDGADGTRYRQESFAALLPRTGALASFVRVDAEGVASDASEIRFTPPQGAPLRYPLRRGEQRSVFVAWRPPARPVVLSETAYAGARSSVADYWTRRLAEGASIEVPEKRVNDAARNLLIQNLGLTWRYSVGNAYEQFSFPEGVDVAQVMAAYGFRNVSAAILGTSLSRSPTPYANWKIGQKLVGSALHYRLFRDAAYVSRVTPVLRGYVDILGRELAASPRGLLPRERYSSDIPDSVYGLHSQAIAWQGLRSMGWVWERTGHPALAARSIRLATRLENGLRRAIRASQVELPDGSLFIPAQLLDGVAPYSRLTASRLGSYWNLVVPYALASGLFAPGSREASGVLRYMLRHGSRFVGLVRAGAYALYGRRADFPTSGTDEVYGLNVARFLADNHRADQLVLSLYGHLAAGMTPGTFVAGEAASIAPIGNTFHRSMYLPPNGASNGSFLERLRLLLVHETLDRSGRPAGLELAYSTPRAWLRPGLRIAARRIPTSFGVVSFSIAARSRSVRVVVDVPRRSQPSVLRLRLRLPGGNRVTRVFLDGRAFRGFDSATETIDLSGKRGRLQLEVAYGR